MNEQYQSALLEKILDTDFYYGVPYKIDYAKYMGVILEHLEFPFSSNIKEGESVVFSAEKFKLLFSDETCTLYVSSSSDKEGIFYDRFCFERKFNETDKPLNKRFKRFVKEILSCIIDVDKNALKGLKKAEIKELHKIQAKLDKIDEILAKK